MLVGSTLLNNYDLLSPTRRERFKSNEKDFIVKNLYQAEHYKNLQDSNTKVDILINEDIYEILQSIYVNNLRDTLFINIQDAKVKYRVYAATLMLTLKLSHMHYDLKNNSWSKHLHDIQYLFSLGYKPNELALLQLKKEWTKLYQGKDKINLNKKPEEFFVANCNQSHDELHKHFAFGSEPIYKKMLKDGHEVAVSFNKFTNLTLEEKLYSVIEESMVIAYERNLSLLNGFKHLYTKLSKGWWNDYITLNFKEVIQAIEEYTPLFKSKSQQLRN